MSAMLRKAVLLAVIPLLWIPVAVAQNNRTAVSITGSDAASCTVPDPCRTFAVALSKTNPNGEVVALTSGGYGPFTIDKSATIVAAPGIYAALVATTGSAILVNAAANSKVVIRGLHLYGMGFGTNGINALVSEEVHIENCVINGFANRGVTAQSNVRISDTTFRGNFVGISLTSGSAVIKGTINRVAVGDGIGGIEVLTNANVTVRDSVVADIGGGGVGFFTEVNGQLNIENSLATNNATAIQANSGGTVRVSNTMATDNGTGFLNDATSTFVSWGNNKVRGNTTDKSGTITLVTQD